MVFCSRSTNILVRTHWLHKTNNKTDYNMLDNWIHLSQQRWEFSLSTCSFSPIRRRWRNSGIPKGRNVTIISDLPGRQLFGEKTRPDHGPQGLGFNPHSYSIRNVVATCPVLSIMPEHGSTRKSGLHLSVRMMLAVGPAGAHNLCIHMTSQVRNSLVLQRRLHRAYINSG